MKRLAWVSTLFALAVIATPLHAGDRTLGDLGKVGKVDFPTSCDPALQKQFERGLALLHSFFYEEARRVFTDIAARDPECAMAHWGVAMTWYHPIWTAPDSAELEAGAAAARRAAEAAKASGRERAYVRAVTAYFLGQSESDAAAVPGQPSCHGPGGLAHGARAQRFRAEMEALATAHPSDVDAAAFLALALLGTAPAGDAKLTNPRRAAEILERWYAKRRTHPGLVHYLIHSYDYPELALQGLPAARAYASIAPWVPHALHMPSHIFTRLGMWKESVASNAAAAEAARHDAALHHPGATSFEEVHALDYQMYALLQGGQDAAARAILDRVRAMERFHPARDFVVAYALGAMPARYALERRQWKEAAALEPSALPFLAGMPFAEGHVVYARAVGAAKSGDLPAARAAAERLGALADAAIEPRFKYFADHMRIQHKAALGLVALAEGRKDEAIAALREAADAEDRHGKHPVSPGAMLPIRELLGEALLESGRPGDALAAFEASLEIYPGRFNGVYGAARAAARAGRMDQAARFQRELASLASGASQRPELAEMRELTAGD